jgi:hypothetical protein
MLLLHLRCVAMCTAKQEDTCRQTTLQDAGQLLTSIALIAGRRTNGVDMTSQKLALLSPIWLDCH